jgi:hypothetical protein
LRQVILGKLQEAIADIIRQPLQYFSRSFRPHIEAFNEGDYFGAVPPRYQIARGEHRNLIRPDTQLRRRGYSRRQMGRDELFQRCPVFVVGRQAVNDDDGHYARSFVRLDLG